MKSCETTLPVNAKVMDNCTKSQIWIKGLLLIVTLLSVAYLFEVVKIDTNLNKAWIDSEIRSRGVVGEVLFVCAGALVTAIGIPRQPVSFLAGYAFGFLPGSALGVLATVLGSLIAFFYARWFGRDLIAARYSSRLVRINSFLQENTFTTAMMIRLLPVGNNLLTNLAAGISNVRALPFLMGSAFGYWPQTAVFALLGSGICVNPIFRIGLGVFLFLVSGALGSYIYRRTRNESLGSNDLPLHQMV